MHLAVNNRNLLNGWNGGGIDMECMPRGRNLLFIDDISFLFAILYK
ncbi:MAG TPA: hypothetical protein PLV81_04520 [Spirochaetota bacterium]|nr:hypothetical protein [Spirochaetota bacterium]